MNEDQAVADTEELESQTAGSEGGAQEDDLDNLLKQFEDDKSEPAQEKADLTREDLKTVVEFTRQAQQDKVRADIDRAVDLIHENLDDGVAVSKNALRRMLNGAAGEDERIQKAWMNRGIRPDLYEKTLKAIAREWSNELRPIDRAATETREAVTNAVRGASKQAAAQPEDYSKVAYMSDQEFEQWKREEARKLK